MIEFEELPEFERDFKKRSKKYRHFPKDFDVFKDALRGSLPEEHLRGTFRISDLGDTVQTPIYKVKGFKSSDFSGKGIKSGFRIIYAYSPDDECVTFIEVYHKNKQENESRDRIYNYFKVE